MPNMAIFLHFTASFCKVLWLQSMWILFLCPCPLKMSVKAIHLFYFFCLKFKDNLSISQGF